MFIMHTARSGEGGGARKFRVRYELQSVAATLLVKLESKLEIARFACEHPVGPAYAHEMLGVVASVGAGYAIREAGM